MASTHLGALMEDRHPAREPQKVNGPSQESGSAVTGVEKDHDHLGPRLGHDEAGESAARSQIDHAGRLWIFGGKSTGHNGESLGMTYLWLQSPGTEKSSGTGLGQDGRQRGGGAGLVGPPHRQRVSPRAR